MKTVIIPILLLFVSSAISQDKIKARLSVQYTKVTNGDSYLSLSVKYKSESGFMPASGMSLQVYQKAKDSLQQLGDVTTAENGTARFVLNKAQPVLDMVTYVARIENDSKFGDAEIEVTVADANLTAKLETIDSVNQISATLTDASGQPLAGQPLRVQLQRLYAPLLMGEESYDTDEAGNITVPLDEPMPGVNGLLNFEVVLSESENYGTIKTLVTAPIGTPVKDESTFDKRTMWSPPSKTPYYLLFFPNLIILGVWLTLLILIVNLYRISKSK